MLSLADAAIRIGKGKSTLHRAYKAGKVSATLDEQGRLKFDPAELARVYPDDYMDEQALRDKQEHAISSQRNDAERHEIALLQVELKLIKEQLAQLQTLSSREIEQAADTIDDLRNRLTTAEKEKSSLTVLLEHHTKQDETEPEPKGFFAKLFA